MSHGIDADGGRVRHTKVMSWPETAMILDNIASQQASMTAGEQSDRTHCSNHYIRKAPQTELVLSHCWWVARLASAGLFITCRSRLFRPVTSDSNLNPFINKAFISNFLFSILWEFTVSWKGWWGLAWDAFFRFLLIIEKDFDQFCPALLSSWFWFNYFDVVHFKELLKRRHGTKWATVSVQLIKKERG